GFNISCNARPCPYYRTITYCNMIFYRCTSTDYNKITQSNGPCQSAISCHNTIFAQNTIMTNLYEIVNFTAVPYNCSTKFTSVNTRVGTYFNLISYNHITDLRNLY